MEGIKIDQMYLENLDEWILEENKVVTYKFLSRSLKVHVNTAKQMLWNYVQTKPGACKGIVYLVSGQAKVAEGGGSVVSLVKEAELPAALARLERVYSQHVYSVQLNETINAASLYATDLEVFKEDPFGCCQHSAITNRTAVAREAVAPPKVAPGVQLERVRPKEVKKAGGIETAFAKVARKPSDDLPAAKSASVKTEAKPKRSPEKKSQSASGAGGSKKPAGGIANFFAAQAARPKVEKVKVEEVKVEECKDTKGEEKENIVNNQKNKEVVTKEKPAKELIKKPTKKKAETKSFGKKDKEETEDGKKRKRIQVMSDSEEEEEMEERSEGEEREEAPPQAKLLESDSEDEVIPATPKSSGGSGRPGRRRVRRQVDKTYVDSDGFMVTKKVVESGSETDEEKPEEEVKKKPEPKKVVEAAKASPAKKAKLAVKPAVKKQGGIQSFFTKKT